MMNVGTFGASHVSMGSSPNKIHVLLVEHETKDRDKTINMLQYCSYQVSLVNLASTALSILSNEKVQFELVIANINSPDLLGFQLLQVAIKMGLLVILMSNDDDAPTTMRALEQGAFLCVKKPVTMQILEYLWQHVSREKLCRFKGNNSLTKVVEYSLQAEELREEDVVDVEKHKSKKKVNLGTSEHGNFVFKRKIWTEWTAELHHKFMDAAKQLGQGRCYPKDILELMNVPGLTRMQVASHLQKCRNAKWLPPEKRKSKQAKAETSNKPPRSKTMKFGSMPYADEPNHHELTSDLTSESSNNGCHSLHLLNEDSGAFYSGQFGLMPFSMDEPFVYDAQSATPISNISSNNFNDDAFEIPIMDSLIQNFSVFQEGGMDFINGRY